MKILIDNGHGSNTPGKCSPDRRLREYAWSREIAQRIEAKLKSLGYDTQRIVTEDIDVSLTERCRRVNNICSQVGKSNCLLVSIHINAAGSDGQWHNATGWSGWVSNNCSQNSIKLAKLLYAEAEKRNLKGNRCVPYDKYWKANFTIIANTHCPAVLTENLFQDNKDEVNYLLSEAGKCAIVDLHVDGIIKYINSL